MNWEEERTQYREVIEFAMCCDTCEDQVGTFKFFPEYLKEYKTIKSFSNFQCVNCRIREQEGQEQNIKQAEKEAKKLMIW